MLQSNTRVLQLLLLLLFAVPLALIAQTSNDFRTQFPNEKPKDRDKYYFNMRAYPFGDIPKDAQLNAMYYVQDKMVPFAKRGNSTLSLNEWRPIGPNKIGGRVRCIVVHPNDGNTLWIGAASGGVWKTTDRGGSWNPIMDQTNSTAMGALAIDPSNPDIMYAGTGELSSNTDAYTGAGIMKSEDGGITWRPIGLTNVGAFSKIIVNPANTQIIYAGATKNNGGFYRSEDGGATWKRTSEHAVSDITINSQNPYELWVGTMTNGILYSNSSGQSFSFRNSGIGPGRTTVNRISVQSAPSDPNILYALAYETLGSEPNQTTYTRIYKSVNKGESWNTVYDVLSPPPPQRRTGDFLGNGAGSQGWYNNVIAIKPNDPNSVIAGGVLYVYTTNGGADWVLNGGPHPDHHVFVYDPSNPNVVFNGNDGGVAVSTDAGKKFTAINNGLAITQFYALAVDQVAESVTYGGTQDNGTIHNTSTEYGELLGGDGFYVAVNHENNNIIFVEAQFGEIYRVDLSTDDRVWLRGDMPNAGIEPVGWAAPLAIDPYLPNVLYSGRTRIWRTTNALADINGIEWSAISPPLSGTVSAMGISPVDNDVIYGGSDRGTIIMTRNGGTEWNDLTFGKGLPNRAVTDFAFSRVDAGTAYIAFSGFYTSHIYKTTDYGDSWTDIGSFLPDIPVNALALHPENENVIYAGTDIGLFITLDGGSTWGPYNNGLPRVAVSDLEVHYNNNTLRMSTHGRSMFEVDLEVPVLPPSITSPLGGELWMGGTPHVISWSGFTDPQGVHLDYSLDGGITWYRLRSGLAGNSFRWNLVDTTSILVHVRVMGVSAPEQTAISRSFTIEKFREGGLLSVNPKPTIPYGIAYDGEFLWTTDFSGNTLLKLDPPTLNVIERIQLDPAMGDSLFTDLTYYPVRNTFFIHRLNSTTDNPPGGWLFEVKPDGEEVARWQTQALYPIGLAWLGEKNPGLPYLLATDRNDDLEGHQNIYLYDPQFLTKGSPLIDFLKVVRINHVPNGPRGAAADTGSFWQVITDFSGGSSNDILVKATTEETTVDNFDSQITTCVVDLETPLRTSGLINARGIEVDPSDRNLWVTDYEGNIYKITSCYGKPGDIDQGEPIVVTGVPTDAASSGINLEQNYPNPFGGTTEIRFTLPFATQATVLVYDMNGTLVRTLADTRFDAGAQHVTFDPTGLPAGAYQYALMLENGTVLSRVMMFLK